MTLPKGSGPRFSRWRRIAGCVPGAAIILACAIYTLFAGNPLDSSERRWHDQLMRWRADSGFAPDVDPHVVHLDVTAPDLGTSSDLASEYRNAADIIDEASELHASAIVFDVVFGRGARETAQPILDAMERARSRNCAVVLSEFMRDDGEYARSFPFRERMTPAGLINVNSDADGVFRRYALLQKSPQGLEPSLALAAYIAWRKMDWSRDVSSSGADSVSWEELSADNTSLETRRISTAPMLLNFRVPWETRGSSSCRRYTRAQLRSIYDAKQELANPGASPLADRVIFVSYVGPGIGDAGTTPLATNQPRVLLHISALNDLIQQSALKRLSRSGEAWALATLLVFGVAAQFCKRTRWLMALWLLITISALGLSFALLVHARLFINSAAIVAIWSAIIGAELIQRSRKPAGTSKLPSTVPRRGGILAPPDPRAVSLRTQRVFISARSTDYGHAKQVHEFLTSRGVPSFFSEESLHERGSADFRKEIDKALDEADHMIVVASSAANVGSPWVEAEWGFFLNETRAGKKSGNLIIVGAGLLASGDLPPGLRYYQIIQLNAEGLETLLLYLNP